ncbi:MAG: SH3 domain-containing protein [Proteobacteria bacterium]|nr:SH3 domain-containing protein [Pseudomonadota bacterium]
MRTVFFSIYWIKLLALSGAIVAGVITCSPLAYSQPRGGLEGSEDLQKTLMNAELAIMEGLSVQALGAQAPNSTLPSTLPSSLPSSLPTSLPIVVPSKRSVVAPLPVVTKPKAPTIQALPVIPAIGKTAPSAPNTATLIPAKQTQPAANTTDLQSQNEALRRALKAQNDRITLLEQELQESRNEHSLAEVEARRLSTMVDAKTRASLGKYNVPMPATYSQPVIETQKVAPLPHNIPVDVKPPSPNAELQIATISVDKADLRLGPGKNNSALMSLRRGSRLAVEARQGEWYRVFAPNGQRAWVHASLVTFGEGASSLNDGSSVRVKGFTTNVEEEAFRRLQKMNAGN